MTLSDPSPTCLDCGAVLNPVETKLRSGQPICGRCQTSFREDMRAHAAEVERQRQADRERLNWARECGIPEAESAESLTLGGGAYGEGWDDYTVESLGVRETPPAWPPPWPFYQIGPMVTRVYGRRVRFRDAVPWIEARWSPDGDQTIALRGLEHATITDARSVLRGLPLVRIATSRRGKPRGSGAYPTAQVFHAACFAARERFRRENRKPLAEHIASELCLSRSRYFELMNQWPTARRSRE